MGKTKGKRRASPKQKQVPQGRYNEAHVAVVDKGQNEMKKTYYHKTRTTEDSFRTIKNPTIKNNPGSGLDGTLS